MSYNFFGDFQTFMQDVGFDRLFGFNIYRKIYTPYEQAEKFVDESMFEDSYSSFGYIREVIPLGYDYLLGIEEVYEDNDYEPSENPTITYYRLSELRLFHQNMFDDE